MSQNNVGTIRPADHDRLTRPALVVNVAPKMAAPSAPTASGPELKVIFVLAWLLCAIFYAYQYAVRSAPGVMQGELSAAWGGNYIGALIAVYYVAYAVMALVAGVLLDRCGARNTIPFGIGIVGVGCLVFSQGSLTCGMLGFALQAIGAIFGFIGASYVAARYLPSRMLAIFLGWTQCLGMAGAAFGCKPVQAAIDPAGRFSLSWHVVWIAFAVIGFVLAIATWLIMPKEKGDSDHHHGSFSLTNLVKPFKVVCGNPQSWLAGVIGGLLFVPTTIGALVWATAFLHNGEHLSMATAASVASLVPIGWVVGCPLMGFIADHLGRRKPPLIAGALVVLATGLIAVFVPTTSTFARYAVALVFGIASGAAMIPFSMMKEANPPEVKGTAAGAMNFLVFLTTGLMSPLISRLMVHNHGAPLTLAGFQEAFMPLLGGVVFAIILSIIIRETGHQHA